MIELLDNPNQIIGCAGLGIAAIPAMEAVMHPCREGDEVGNALRKMPVVALGGKMVGNQPLAIAWPQ